MVIHSKNYFSLLYRSRVSASKQADPFKLFFSILNNIAFYFLSLFPSSVSDIGLLSGIDTNTDPTVIHVKNLAPRVIKKLQKQRSTGYLFMSTNILHFTVSKQFVLKYEVLHKLRSCYTWVNVRSKRIL